MSTAWTNGPTVEKLTYLWPSPIPTIGNISHSKHDVPIPPSCSSPRCLVQLGLTSIFCLNKSCLGPRGKEKIKEHAAPACIDWPQKKILQDELVVRLFRTPQYSIGKIFSCFTVNLLNFGLQRHWQCRVWQTKTIWNCACLWSTYSTYCIIYELLYMLCPVSTSLSLLLYVKLLKLLIDSCPLL